MQYLVTAKEMKLLDKNTSAHFHIPELVLMERAALAFVRELFSLEKMKSRPWKRALILCGSGNNGADGLAVARLLTQEGRCVCACVCGEAVRLKTTDSYRVQREICASYRVWVREDVPGDDFDLVIDAVFGTGLARNVEGVLADVLSRANRMEAWRVALDISSGLSADTGRTLGETFCADDTITFAFGKRGQFLWPGNEFSGRVHVVPMGITEESFLGEHTAMMAPEPCDLSLSARRAHSNKGTYGRLLVVAGSVNMAGAACLCARAAYRSGCGLVRVLTAEENRVILQSAVPEAVLSTYGSGLEEEAIADTVRWADAVVLGPGIGTDGTARALVSHVMQYANVPVVLDADALNILSEEKEQLLLHGGKGWILTPHLGEMSRLTGRTVASLQEDLCGAAELFAKEHGYVCVLKDFRTVTATMDGRLYLNLSGNPGMATAGSGDVLAGIIGSLVAQGMESEKAAVYGVYLHGLAGDAAAKSCGMRAMTAGDIVEHGIREVLRGFE